MNGDPQTYEIIGAAMEVHRTLGHGFLEAVYQEALEWEFVARGVPYKREVEIPVHYKSAKLRCGYRADFLCFDAVLVETKAMTQLTGVDEAQAINYMKATDLHRALLFNFGSSSLQHKRLVLNLRESAQSADQTVTL
jgi:GxxExxY protein